MSNVTCHCGNTASFDEDCSHIPEGWDRIATFDQKLIWLCPTCYEKVKYHAQEIFKLTGNKYPSIRKFIPMD